MSGTSTGAEQPRPVWGVCPISFYAAPVLFILPVRPAVLVIQAALPSLPHRGVEQKSSGTGQASGVSTNGDVPRGADAGGGHGGHRVCFQKGTS